MVHSAAYITQKLTTKLKTQHLIESKAVNIKMSSVPSALHTNFFKTERSKYLAVTKPHESSGSPPLDYEALMPYLRHVVEFYEAIMGVQRCGGNIHNRN